MPPVSIRVLTMAKAKTPKRKSRVVYVSIPSDLIARFEAHGERIKVGKPGTIALSLVREGLDAAEARASDK